MIFINADERTAIYNSLGSDEEVAKSRIGPDGALTGTPTYAACKFDDGIAFLNNLALKDMT